MLLEKLFPNITVRQKDALRLAEAALLIILGLMVFVFLPAQLERQRLISPSGEGPVRQAAVNAYTLAVVKAKEWDPDPKLVTINSSGGSLDQTTGQSTFFRVWFSASQKENAGYEVLVEEGEVKQAGEFIMYRPGAALSPKVMTEQEAIEKLHQIPGYAEEEIVSTELVYEDASKAWYWGIKTKGHGVVAFEAEKK